MRRTEGTAEGDEVLEFRARQETGRDEVEQQEAITPA
jgi:hypothetical protein